MTDDWLLLSDVISGAIAAVFASVSGLDKKMWMPFAENTALSVLGRMGQKQLDWTKDGKAGPLKTADVRSDIIVFVSSLLIHKVGMNHGTQKSIQHALLSVSSDALSDEITFGLFGEKVLIEKKKP